MKHEFDEVEETAKPSAGEDVKLPEWSPKIQWNTDAISPSATAVMKLTRNGGWVEVFAARKVIDAALKENARLKKHIDHTVQVLMKNTTQYLECYRAYSVQIDRAEQAEAALALRDAEIARLGEAKVSWHISGSDGYRSDACSEAAARKRFEQTAVMKNIESRLERVTIYTETVAIKAKSDPNEASL